MEISIDRGKVNRKKKTEKKLLHFFDINIYNS